MFAITWKELQKNIFVIVTFAIITIGASLVYNNYLPGIFDDDQELEMLATNFSMMLGIFVNMIIFSGLMSCEKEEEQSNGYSFLRNLPIDSWQIVVGKFLAGFLYAIYAISLVAIVSTVFGVKLESDLLPVSYSFFSGGLALVLLGILYTFAFRIRYSKLLPIIMIVYILSMMAPQITHFLLLITERDSTVEQLFSGLTLPTGASIFAGGVIIFCLIGFFAIKVKEQTPVPR